MTIGETNDSWYKPRRLGTRDYSASGLYFVTICANYMRDTFGRIVDSRVGLTSLGQIAHESWIAIPEHFAAVNLHAFVVMPNHMHGLIELAPATRVQGSMPQNKHATLVQSNRVDSSRRSNARTESIPAIVRSYKAEVTRRAREELKWRGEVWQRNYFDRVLRDGQEFSDISRYIEENPSKWQWEREAAAAKAYSTGKSRAACCATTNGGTATARSEGRSDGID
jgi:REP element-mobilizing transposase RayT